MSARTAAISLVSLVAVGIVTLLILASTHQRADAFSLDVPTTGPVASIPPEVTACQGPIHAVVGFAGVQAQIVPAGVATLTMSVRDLGGQTIASGRLRTARELAGPTTWRLNATVPSGRLVALCIRDAGPAAVTLLGGVAFPSAGSLRVGSGATTDVASFVFERVHPRSVLSLIPAMFGRAGLFKASWVGSWTFWLLSVGLLGAVALVGAALLSALGPADPDERQSPPAAETDSGQAR